MPLWPGEHRIRELGWFDPAQLGWFKRETSQIFAILLGFPRFERMIWNQKSFARSTRSWTVRCAASWPACTLNGTRPGEGGGRISLCASRAV